MLKRKIIAGLIIGFVLLSIIIAALYGKGRGTDYYGRSGSGSVVGVIQINGTIVSGVDSSSLFSTVAGSEGIMKQLRRAAQDPSVKAVVLRLNTPGGSVAGAQEIALEVDRLRQEGKKVVASMGDVAASGGYWIACRCDKIVANPGTMTGSIGVIMETQNLQGLYDKLGIDPVVFKSGPHKDMGSTSRVVSEQEQQIFQRMVDDIYLQFVDTVAEGRGMTEARVREVADGRIFTGSQALENGLVDDLGNYYDAIELAAGLAGIKGEPEVIHLSPEYPWWGMLSGMPTGELSINQWDGLLLHKIPFE
ncbi:putative signal peptide peptidase SppA [Sporotomaculum syntrophicum]|uniref:Signal peptide peptidase SppA n=1 Tax=Sporotomaculum syntrophicum TaxID=182264 RepID=A0A9D3AZM1_9FIRM|nr:signal peptide peptidase SppA [Sporotomaculum syntrophicum]KAF1085993.1 putative signal peptide peptidase SppA [Sporotomaculum syntrophicum]